MFPAEGTVCFAAGKALTPSMEVEATMSSTGLGASEAELVVDLPAGLESTGSGPVEVVVGVEDSETSGGYGVPLSEIDADTSNNTTSFSLTHN